jgi:voltage-gated potassium channel
LRLLSNVARLFSGLGKALREPEVQGVLTLALTLVAIAAVFYWLVEGWPFLDALYFSVVTIATVGFGDFTPHTVLGKLFTIVYIFAGIGLFASAVATLARAILRADTAEKSKSDARRPD